MTLSLALFADADVFNAHAFEGHHDGARAPNVEDDRDRQLSERLSGSSVVDARAAMDALVTTYFDRLIRFAYGLVRSADVAEDVVQEVLLRVWEARSTIRADRAIRTYLFTAVRRRALDVLKHQRVASRHAEAFRGDDVSIQLTVDERLDAERVERAVQRAMTRLPERRATVLRLRYEMQLPFAAVGDVMGISEKAAKDLAARAIRELRQLLGVETP